MVLDESMLRRGDALREMLELARFIVADGEVSELEAKIFQRWIDQNPDMLHVHPVEQLVGTLRTALADGVLSDAEKESLRKLLEELAG